MGDYVQNMYFYVYQPESLSKNLTYFKNKSESNNQNYILVNSKEHALCRPKYIKYVCAAYSSEMPYFLDEWLKYRKLTNFWDMGPM